MLAQVDQPLPPGGLARPARAVIAAEPLSTIAPAVEVEARIVETRRDQRRDQDWIGPELGVPARTVSRVLRRHGLPYLRECGPLTGQVIRASKTTAVHYERTLPGEPDHVDVKKARID